jgi:hypothetical protein
MLRLDHAHELQLSIWEVLRGFRRVDREFPNQFRPISAQLCFGMVSQSPPALIQLVKLVVPLPVVRITVIRLGLPRDPPSLAPTTRGPIAPPTSTLAALMLYDWASRESFSDESAKVSVLRKGVRDGMRTCCEQATSSDDHVVFT